MEIDNIGEAKVYNMPIKQGKLTFKMCQMLSNMPQSTASTPLQTTQLGALSILQMVPKVMIPIKTTPVTQTMLATSQQHSLNLVPTMEDWKLKICQEVLLFLVKQRKHLQWTRLD